MNHQIAQTEMVRSMDRIYRFVASQDYEQMALIWGEPGQGKTTAARFLVEEHEAIYITAYPNWTAYQIVYAILSQITKEVPKSFLPAMEILKGRLRELNSGNNPIKRGIIIDEFEEVARKSAVLDIVRAIHDCSDVPLILIGQTGLEPMLRKKPVFHDRIVRFAEAPLIKLEDAKILISAFSQYYQFSNDLIEDMISNPLIAGNIRRFKRAFFYMQSLLLEDQFERQTVTLYDWQGRGYFPQEAFPPEQKVLAFTGGR